MLFTGEKWRKRKSGKEQLAGRGGPKVGGLNRDEQCDQTKKVQQEGGHTVKSTQKRERKVYQSHLQSPLCRR